MKIVCYVDEAGDEGFGKLRTPGAGGQSKWLFIGALIATEAHDRCLPAWRNELSARLFPGKDRRELHFRNLNHNQRVAACNHLADKPLGICVVGSNKLTIIGSGKEQVFKQKGYLYNYLVRYVLERVTAACKKKGAECQLRVVFSRRGGTDYQSMRDYLILMREGKEVVRPARSIDWRSLIQRTLRWKTTPSTLGCRLQTLLPARQRRLSNPTCLGTLSLDMRCFYTVGI